MSAPQDFKELYADEMKDLWSANDQMAHVLPKLAAKVSDPQLKEMLNKSQKGIAEHTAALKQLIQDAGEKVAKEHCKGMEGLVAEATKHVTEEAPEKGPLLDAVIIAQYQRMTHYGIAGFGTAAAYAGALGETEAQQKLKGLVKEIYNGDEYATRLSKTVNADAKAENA